MRKLCWAMSCGAEVDQFLFVHFTSQRIHRWSKSYVVMKRRNMTKSKPLWTGLGGQSEMDAPKCAGVVMMHYLSDYALGNGVRIYLSCDKCWYFYPPH